MYYSIVHLVDDSSGAGVDRLLDFIAASPEMAKTGVHKIVRVKRHRATAPDLAADLIVSHLRINWANLPLFVSLRAKYAHTPLVHVEHNYCERRVALDVKHVRRFETLMRSVTSLFDHVIAVSEVQAKWLRRKGYGPGGRISVIKPCVDLAPLLAIAPRRPATPRVVGFLGAADPQSGLDILIDAFKDARLNRMALHVYGEACLLEAACAQAAGAANIVFAGSAETPAAAIAACDLVAMPSRWEPYGVMALEAMASSRPLVCSRVDGLATHIAGGAIEVATNSPDGWVDVLTALPGLDLDLTRARGRRHARAVREEFVDAWSDLIQKAVGTAGYDRIAA